MMDSTIYGSNDGTLYLPNAVASSSISSPSSPQDEQHSSRMRSHKGNKPSLPQSKHCPLCPAKFTRTTHLNRHLRTRVSLFRIYAYTQANLYDQIRMNDSIVVMYVILDLGSCFALSAAPRLASPSLPVVTCSRGTSGAVAIRACLLIPGT